ncbi:MAG: DNA-3-methyladenine glycosylase [Burkholderiaceae bacterium]|nr:DNA-3-methyladenine glycosylase [Burkholderiaceae bacterium]
MDCLENLPAGWPVDFRAEPLAVARRLIGVTLLVAGAGGVIVETEAYDAGDPASHSHGGPTARNAAMFGPPGHAYVYRSYGIHWCLNFVCCEAGRGAAVLIRALQPTHGIALMQARRGMDDVRLLCAGPGRLGQALAVAREYDGAPLDTPPFVLIAPRQALPDAAIACGARIGISRAVERPWRFGLKDSAFLSRRF